MPQSIDEAAVPPWLIAVFLASIATWIYLTIHLSRKGLFADRAAQAGAVERLGNGARFDHRGWQRRGLMAVDLEPPGEGSTLLVRLAPESCRSWGLWRSSSWP